MLSRPGWGRGEAALVTVPHVQFLSLCSTNSLRLDSGTSPGCHVGPRLSLQMGALTLKHTSFAVAHLLAHLRAGQGPSDEALAG